MISLLLNLSVVRRSMYALVRGSWLSLTTTMRKREEAGIGFTPHSDAKAASERWR